MIICFKNSLQCYQYIILNVYYSCDRNEGILKILTSGVFATTAMNCKRSDSIKHGSMMANQACKPAYIITLVLVHLSLLLLQLLTIKLSKNKFCVNQ